MSSFLREYNAKLVSAAEAAKLVKSEMVIEYGQFATKPVDFDAALGARAGDPDLTNVTVRATGSVLPVPEVVKSDPEQKSFHYGSWYCTALDRKLSDYGLCVHYPFNYHEANNVVTNELFQHRWVDVWVAQVAPMDASGFFNFGIANSHNYSIGSTAGIRIVEVNPNMPRCLGGFEEGIHISEVDYIVEGSGTPIFALPDAKKPTPAEETIAQYIVDEVQDGSCLQLGIGALPNTIGNMLADSDLKDLGVLSEMFCDSFVDMYENGRITNKKKAFERGKSTYTFCLGTQKTYDFINDNPLLSSCPVQYTNDPARIRMNDRMVSINNILEIDLLSQVCSESKGLRQISGTGGQLDFVIGAYESNQGKSFLAFTSTFTDSEGKLHSRVRPLLTPGAVVTVPRTMVYWVVTEYGKVNLKALSIWERAQALIDIAHPDFREELIQQAEQMKIWRPSNKLEIPSSRTAAAVG
ncbi:MAG: acetyl-CoA hydrolase/transferase family protein [Solirubrobacterales bacterium]